MRKTKNVIQVPATDVKFSLMSLSKETSANHPLGMKVMKKQRGVQKEEDQLDYFQDKLFALVITWIIIYIVQERHGCNVSFHKVNPCPAFQKCTYKL